MGLTSPSGKKSMTMIENCNLMKMLGSNIYFFKMAGVLGASAVILGAYGAHGKLQHSI